MYQCPTYNATRDSSWEQPFWWTCTTM